jgi:hypothetical protein
MFPWFVNEQVEEEKQVKHILEQVRVIGLRRSFRKGGRASREFTSSRRRALTSRGTPLKDRDHGICRFHWPRFGL